MSYLFEDAHPIKHVQAMESVDKLSKLSGYHYKIVNAPILSLISYDVYRYLRNYAAKLSIVWTVKGAPDLIMCGKKDDRQ